MSVQKSIKQLTIKLVNYTNMTQEERIAKRLAKRTVRKNRSTYSAKWFGVIPLAWRYVFKQK